MTELELAAERADEIFSEKNPIVIDLDDLTIADQEEVEEMTGLPMTAILDTTRPTRKMLHALLFVTARKDFPDVTYEIAGLAKPGGYEWLMEVEEDGGYRLPLEGIKAGSPTIWELASRTTNSEKPGDEIPDTASSGDASSRSSENLTSSQND